MTVLRSLRWTLWLPALLACNSTSRQITEPVVALLPAVLELDGQPVDIKTPTTASVACRSPWRSTPLGAAARGRDPRRLLSTVLSL